MLSSADSGSAFQIVNYLFEKSPECLFVIDSNTLKLMDANQKALDAVGYSKAELLTLGINEIDTSYPGEREATYEEQESNFSTIYKRKDKSTFEVDVNLRGFMHNGCSYLLVKATEIQPSDTSGSFMSSSPKENKATSALAESELRYRTLTETAQEGIWQLDENNNTSFVNEYFAALLGYTKEEMTGKPVFDFIAEEAKTEALQLVEKRRQGIAEQHEFTLKRKDGSPVYTLMQARPLFLEGVYVGALATVLDISERKKQEKEVIEKEKYFRALFENSLDGIALLSGEGVILDISPSIERILGLTRDELLQTSRLDFIVPENTHLVIDTVQKVINDPFTPRTVEYEAIKGGGKRVWLECTYTNLLNESNVNAIVLNFRDITERKHAEKILSESERRYRKAQERAKLAHWEWNIVTNQSYWSEELFRIFRLDPKGIAPDDEKFFAFVHPDDRDQLRRQLHMAIAGNKSYEYVYRIVLENGDVKYLQEIGEVVNDEHRQPWMITGMVQDITGQKVREKQLRESEARYRKAQLQGKLGHWEWDLSTNKLLWSDEIYNMFALDPALVPDLQIFLEAVHPDDRDMLKSKVEQALVEGRDYQLFHRIILPDGTIRHLYEVAELVKDANGQPFKVAGMVQDVTQQKLIEEELSLSERNYRLLFDQSPVPFCMVDDPSLNFLEVNLAAVNLYGYSKEEFLKMNAGDIRWNNDESFFESLNEGEERRDIRQRMVHHKKKNGELILVQLTVNRIVYNGKNVWLASVRDITQEVQFEKQLKQSQHQLSVITNNTVDALSLLTVEGENRFRYEEVNETYTKINGVEREKVVGRLVGEIMPSQNFEQLFTLFNKAITTGQTQKFVSVNIWFDGIRAFELASVPIKGESGSVDKILVIAKDISDQKKAEDALLKTNNELRELSSYLENVREEERKNMAREIHDELGQHLTGIKMEVSWIGRHLQTKDEKIETKIKSSLKLIDETINSVRRIATQLRPSILDDLGLAEALDWQSREFSTRTGLAVEFSSNVNEMIYPSAISSSVFRIFQEALTNITRHAKATKVSSRLEEIGEVLYLTVADNGVGFVIHQQAEGKTLGLLGMKERVAMLNGIYDVQSEPGEGTVISVQIPLA